MNYILIIREEIICLLVILFLALYHAYYQYKEDGRIDGNFFLKISFWGLLHVVLDIVTVYTVNHRELISPTYNKVLHIIFYITGMLFIAEFLGYVIKLTLSYRILRVYKRLMYIPHIGLGILGIFLPVEYVDGVATSYSYGPLVFGCYGGYVVYCIICILLAVVRYSEIDKKTRIAVLPSSALMIIMVFMQAVFPELLITSAGITIVCIGLFITVNNPADVFAHQAYWDAATGLHNKNSYQKLMNMLKKRYQNKKISIGFVVCDMNGLKLINDTYGHTEGDKLIKAAATALLEGFVTAYNVYRVGGDEFVVVYHTPNQDEVLSEMQKVRELCDEFKESPVPLSIAMGYASEICLSDNFDALYQKADELMYEDKKRIKELHPELVRK